jgi:hypothetical protein
VPECEWGGEPKSGSPQWFLYDEAEIATFLPPMAGFVTLSAFGIPTLPQNTAQFCSAGAPTDLPGPADFALMSLPPLGIVSGAYSRYGNEIRRAKWVSLCQCVAAPAPVLADDPPTGFRVLARAVTIAVPAGASFRPQWAGAQLPNGTLEFGYRMVGGDYIGFGRGSGAVANKLATTGLVIGAAPNDFTELNAATGGQAGPFFSQPALAHPTNAGYPYIRADNIGRGAATLIVDLFYAPALDVPPVAPTPVAAPTDYPVSGGPCDAPTNSDLCKKLDALGSKLDYLVNTTVPPKSVPDTIPTPIPPNLDNTGAPLPPGELGFPVDLTKPPAANGAVIQCTTIPSFEARVGENPTYYPALGHYALKTDSGYLPSEVVKHNPQVIFPIPPQVKSLSVALSEGVVGTIVWLYGLT